MLQQDLSDPKGRWWWKHFAGAQEMVDLIEDPGSALGRSTYHDAIGTGEIQNLPRILRALDIPVGDHRNGDRLLDAAYGLVFRLTGKPAGPCPTVHGKGQNAAGFGNACDLDAVAAIGIPTCSDLQGDRYLDRSHNGFQNAIYKCCVP